MSTPTLTQMTLIDWAFVVTAFSLATFALTVSVQIIRGKF